MTGTPDLPDPAGTWIPTPTADLIATTVGEMRARTDLDQWDAADFGRVDSGGWSPCTWVIHLPQDDDFPVIVRRKP